MNSKQPNILVFTGNTCIKLFKNIESNIMKCVPFNQYLVYHLLPSEVMKRTWMETASLLVVSSHIIDERTAVVFEDFVKNCGKLFLICSRFDSLAGFKCVPRNEDSIEICFESTEKISMYRGKCSYISTVSETLCTDNLNQPVIHKTMFNNGIVIVTEIYLDRDFKFFTSKVALMCDDEKRLLVLKKILTDHFGLKPKGEESSINFLTHGYYYSDISKKWNESKNLVYRTITVKFQEKEAALDIYHFNKNTLTFDFDSYFSSLNSDVYGHSLIYFPAISSTMDIAEKMSDCDGIVIIAQIQLNGKGRGTNKWISPVGCAMFTMKLTLPLFSKLGSKLSLIQHIGALAVVHGIKNQPHYKDLDIKIKWPNDIYFNKLKIGGLVVNSTIQEKEAVVNIGWGINVANSEPTMCLNDGIKLFNEKESFNLPLLSIENVVAWTVSQMEYFVKDFQNSGPSKFFSYYYSYWMHSHQEVTLKNLDEIGIIEGLNEYGFLLVKTAKGELLALQPDGNRFDIIKNLVYSKT